MTPAVNFMYSKAGRAEKPCADKHALAQCGQSGFFGSNCLGN